MPLRARITGIGAYLPKHAMDNYELAKKVETNHEWIVERTGIEKRHIAAEGEYTSDLAVNAAKQALERAGRKPQDIDLIIVATETPDLTMPATAVLVQHKLGIAGCGAFDLHAACSGFVYGLWSADAAIRSGQAKRVLVIGAETFSRVVNWEDRGTCILFGDGAGAAVVEAQEVEKDGPGILAAAIFSDGSLSEILKTTGGVSSTKSTGYLTMSGKEVFRHAVGKMCEALDKALHQAGLEIADIDLLVPHQANRRIIQAIGQRLGLDEKKVVDTIGIHANTSAASIPLALEAALAAGRIKEGNIIALQALGAGLTWGACLIRW